MLHKISIEGNRAFSDMQLKLRMNKYRKRVLPFTSRRLIEKPISEDVKDLLTFYRKGKARKRFPECIIDPSIKIDSSGKKATAVFTITEGPRYKVGFKGTEGKKLKSEIKRIRRKLKKELVIFDNGNRNDLGLRKSVQKMKRFYRDKGYNQTRVTLKDSSFIKKDLPGRHVTFIIDEGPCPTVSSISVSGNKAFESKRIQGQILTQIKRLFVRRPFVEETFKNDMQAIITLYRNNGYRNASATHTLTYSENNTEVAIAIEITEGIQTIISTVTFDSLSVITDAEAYKATKLKAGAPYRRALIRSDEIALSALIAERGHPYVKIRPDLQMNSDSSRAQLTYRIDEGPRVYMGNIYYAGNFKTKNRVMRQEIGIEPGQPFSLRKMLEGQKDLRNLNIFNTVSYKTIGLKEREDTVRLFIEMEEKKPYFMETGIGYESGLFWGKVKGGDHNFLGLNKDLGIGARLTHVLGYRMDLGFKQPRLFGFPIKNITELYIERIIEAEQDFSVMSYGASLGISRRIVKHLTSTAAFVFERRRRDQSGVTDSVSSDESRPRNLFTITPTLSYDRRDSYTRPKKGVFSTLSITFSNGIVTDIDDFIKYQYELRYYFTPVNRITLASIGRIGYLDPIGDNKKENIPQDQWFFLGGTQDVRGFPENELRTKDDKPLGGRASLRASVEARIDIGLNFELPLFYDVGRIEDSFDFSRDEFRSSAGFGLRYLTPIGPIGLLYGFKLNRKQRKPGEEIGKLHFSLGYTF